MNICTNWQWVCDCKNTYYSKYQETTEHHQKLKVSFSNVLEMNRLTLPMVWTIRGLLTTKVTEVKYVGTNRPNFAYCLNNQRLVTTKVTKINTKMTNRFVSTRNSTKKVKKHLINVKWHIKCNNNIIILSVYNLSSLVQFDRGFGDYKQPPN